MITQANGTIFHECCSLLKPHRNVASMKSGEVVGKTMDDDKGGRFGMC